MFGSVIEVIFWSLFPAYYKMGPEIDLGLGSKNHRFSVPEFSMGRNFPIKGVIVVRI